MSDLLHSYLRDHHAGATAGVEVARRVAGSNVGTPYGPRLERLAAEFAEDRQTLEAIMRSVGATPSRLKDRGAWLAERAARLKRNGTWIAYSPLSRLIELEGLAMGVSSKMVMWRALATVVTEPPEGIDLPGLATRAADQRERLEELHRHALADAFAPAPG